MLAKSVVLFQVRIKMLKRYHLCDEVVQAYLQNAKMPPISKVKHLQGFLDKHCNCRTQRILLLAEVAVAPAHRNRRSSTSAFIR